MVSKKVTEKEKIHFFFFCRYEKSNLKMDSLASIILIVYNYFDQKPKILLHLQRKGLYQIVKNIEVEPTLVVEKFKHFNYMDKDFFSAMLVHIS